VYKPVIEGEWKPITSAVLSMIKEESIRLNISHGICPDCYERIDNEIKFEERRKPFLEETAHETRSSDGLPDAPATADANPLPETTRSAAS
jgi:hypothetical protein